MPLELWIPDPIWKGKPCYIIGGGPSLRDFPFATLEGLPVLGCNAAFYLGFHIVPITIYGDTHFLNQHRSGLTKYAEKGGWVVSTSSSARRNPPPWLKVMKKKVHGMARGGTLGWNGNTGAAAINLALLFGADPVYLLGYDMGLSSDGQANFHNAYSHPSTTKAYVRFLKGMERVGRDLSDMFPDQRVINLEDDSSKLDLFPKQSLWEHFLKRQVTL